MSYVLGLEAKQIIYKQFYKLNEYKLMMNIPYRYETTTFDYKIVITEGTVTVFDLKTNYTTHSNMEVFFEDIINR